MSETAGAGPAAAATVARRPDGPEQLSMLAPASAPLSLREARRRTGLPYERLRAAIDDGRLEARYTRVELEPGRGRTGNPWRWVIDADELDRFVRSLEPCRYSGCERPGIGPSGCCSGAHAQGVSMRGKPRPDVGAKVSATMSGRSRGPHTPERRARIRSGLRTFWNDAVASSAERSRRSSRLREEWEQGGKRPRKFVLSRRRGDGSPWVKQARNDHPGWFRSIVIGREQGKAGGRPRGYSDLQARGVLNLKDQNPGYGIRRLARDTGLTAKQVRAILAQRG